MTKRMRSGMALATLMSVSAWVGCNKSSEPPVVPVSGTVTLDEQPLAEGFVYFKTVETGAVERFDITGGEFAGSAQVGTRRVEIYSNRPKRVVIDGA